MIKIKKDFRAKIVSTIVIITFTVTSICYGVDLPKKSTLRPPVSGNTVEGRARLHYVLDHIQQITSPPRMSLRNKEGALSASILLNILLPVSIFFPGSKNAAPLLFSSEQGQAFIIGIGLAILFFSHCLWWLRFSILERRSHGSDVGGNWHTFTRLVNQLQIVGMGVVTLGISQIFQLDLHPMALLLGVAFFTAIRQLWVKYPRGSKVAFWDNLFTFTQIGLAFVGVVYLAIGQAWMRDSILVWAISSGIIVATVLALKWLNHKDYITYRAHWFPILADILYASAFIGIESLLLQFAPDLLQISFPSIGFPGLSPMSLLVTSIFLGILILFMGIEIRQMSGVATLSYYVWTYLEQIAILLIALLTTQEAPLHAKLFLAWGFLAIPILHRVVSSSTLLNTLLQELQYRTVLLPIQIASFTVQADTLGLPWPTITGLGLAIFFNHVIFFMFHIISTIQEKIQYCGLGGTMNYLKNWTYILYRWWTYPIWFLWAQLFLEAIGVSLSVGLIGATGLVWLKHYIWNKSAEKSELLRDLFTNIKLWQGVLDCAFIVLAGSYAVINGISVMSVPALVLIGVGPILFLIDQWITPGLRTGVQQGKPDLRQYGDSVDLFQSYPKGMDTNISNSL